MKHSLSLLFWLKKAWTNKNGEAPIYVRITGNGKRAEIATGEKINPGRWNSTVGNVRGIAKMLEQSTVYWTG